MSPLIDSATIRKPLASARRSLRSSVTYRADRRLAHSKSDQLERFARLRGEFAPTVAGAGPVGPPELLTPLWVALSERIADALLPEPPEDFLRHDLIKYTMFADAGGRWLRHQRSELERLVAADVLPSLLEEDPVGRPTLCQTRPPTSHNSIHHLYHFIRYAAATDTRLETITSAIEWGGGYGNQCKLLRRLCPQLEFHVIIDLPIFSGLQWLYLSSVFGEDQVSVLGRDSAEIVHGKINLVPVSRLNDLDLTAELFISTWALSESTAAAQDLVVDRDWFGARRLLLAYQDDHSGRDFQLPDAMRVGELASEAGAVVEAIPFQNGRNYYAFA